MPPLSYVITAAVLAALVAASFPMTMGFSIILWYGLFAAAAGLLATAGAFRIARGLQAPLWIGIGLASPGLVWAADHLQELTSHLNMGVYTAFKFATSLALLAAAACALRLAETVSRPHIAVRIGYGVLAIAAFTSCFNLLAYAMGWTFTHNAAYATVARVVAVAATLVKYGAFIAAAALITLRRDVERWTGAVISLVSAYMLYNALRPLFVVDRFGQGDGLAFWLQPVIMLVGGAAVWRLGSLLRAPTTTAQPSGGEQRSGSLVAPAARPVG
jgi:hypothetical protein